jgi:hypothetical protein
VLDAGKNQATVTGKFWARIETVGIRLNHVHQMWPWPRRLRWNQDLLIVRPSRIWDRKPRGHQHSDKEYKITRPMSWPEKVSSLVAAVPFVLWFCHGKSHAVKVVFV